MQDPKGLKSSFFCAQCHQFKFRNSSTYAQQTYNEWKDYRKSGGVKTCQNCHMPNGSHEFQGPHTFKKATTSLEISLERENIENFKLVISNKKAGHSIPTGDVYRHITIETKLKGQNGFGVIATIGRNPYFWKPDQLKFKNDNAIKPGEIRIVSIPEKNIEAVRVIYHFEAPWAGSAYWNKSDLKEKIIFEKEI